jgi:hypothetical protein
VDTAQRGIALRKTLLVLLIVVVIASVGLLVFQKVTYKAEYRKVGDQFITAITNNDATTSFNMMTKRLQNEKKRDGWSTELAGTFKDYTGTPEYFETVQMENPDQVYGKEGAYRVKYRLPYEDKTYVMEMIVKWEKNSWKVDEFLSYIP